MHRSRTDGHINPSALGRRWVRWLRGHQRDARFLDSEGPPRADRRAVVVAAGALGTNQFSLSARADGALPRISDRLGQLVRTNSESMTAVTSPDDRGWGRSVSITSSMHPTGDSHVEAVTYGPGGNAMGLMFTLLTGDGTRFTRPLKLLSQIVRHPIRFVRVTNPRDGHSGRSSPVSCRPPTRRCRWCPSGG